MNPWLNRY